MPVLINGVMPISSGCVHRTQGARPLDLQQKVAPKIATSVPHFTCSN